MPPTPRLGPRPLPLHLGTALMTWASSESAWRLSKSGSPSSNQGSALADLLKEIAAVDSGRFEAALHREIGRRMERLAEGVVAYRRHPFHRDLENPPAAWSEGNTRLLDYGAIHPAARRRGARAVLVVPSLINRAFVLDLSAERSLLRHLARAGVRPLLVDWGKPGDVEATFTLTDYIAGPLEGALDHALTIGRGPVGVIGYCMGGLLALALALRRQADVAQLTLLATPWDFHADHALARRVAAALPWLNLITDALGAMPVDLVQSLFFALDPYLVTRKFEALAESDAASPTFTAFVALEDWINDGVMLAGAVARECMAGWYAANTPARLAWRVAGRIVDPGRFRRPSLVVVPAHDRIVPPASAEALAQALPGARTLLPPLGHIGMVVSNGARTSVWEPLAAWCREQSA
ncbi:MAG: alpha/beta hydrolase [Proteobacteria bacterium]|nr:alpha/beta hydrolase [Pseudomonadota bacterium]